MRRVLFVCSGNRARSQMAEGLLRHLAGDRFKVHSAGTEPKGLARLTVEVMREIRVDVSGQRSRSVEWRTRPTPRGAESHRYRRSERRGTHYGPGSRSSCGGDRPGRG